MMEGLKKEEDEDFQTNFLLKRIKSYKMKVSSEKVGA